MSPAPGVLAPHGRHRPRLRRSGLALGCAVTLALTGCGSDDGGEEASGGAGGTTALTVG